MIHSSRAWLGKDEGKDLIALFEGTLLPLCLVGKMPDGRLYGKTRLQKLFFIFQKRGEKAKLLDPVFEFKIYHYGPYSKDLADVVDSLVRQRLLEERTVVTSSGYAALSYHITEMGERMIQEASEKHLVSEEVIQTLQNVINEFANLELESLVAKAYEYVL
jgi:uncharacterized protein YwgA